MANIYSLDEHRATCADRLESECESQLSGSAVCVACKHQWVAVAPVGTTELECPACHRMTARFMYLVSYNDAHWVCRCGCDLFHITKNGYYCPSCGLPWDGKSA